MYAIVAYFLRPFAVVGQAGEAGSHFPQPPASSPSSEELSGDSSAGGHSLSPLSESRRSESWRGSLLADHSQMASMAVFGVVLLNRSSSGISGMIDGGDGGVLGEPGVQACGASETTSSGRLGARRARVLVQLVCSLMGEDDVDGRKKGTWCKWGVLFNHYPPTSPIHRGGTRVPDFLVACFAYR